MGMTPRPPIRRSRLGPGRHPDPGDRTDEPDEVEVSREAGELVLVVDDDVDALRSVSRTLRRFGYTVLESPSPSRAVEIARVKALQTVRESAGSQLDPEIVDAFGRLMETDDLQRALNLEVVAHRQA